MHLAECGSWLETLKEVKDIRKQDRKDWQGLFKGGAMGWHLGPLAGTRTAF